MPYSPQEKKQAQARVRRIAGQVEALGTALGQEADCGKVLQQIAAIRGAVNGLMADVLESHIKASLGIDVQGPASDAVDDTLALIRSYLR